MQSVQRSFLAAIVLSTLGLSACDSKLKAENRQLKEELMAVKTQLAELQRTPAAMLSNAVDLRRAGEYQKAMLVLSEIQEKHPASQLIPQIRREVSVIEAEQRKQEERKQNEQRQAQLHEKRKKQGLPISALDLKAALNGVGSLVDGQRYILTTPCEKGSDIVWFCPNSNFTVSVSNEYDDQRNFKEMLGWSRSEVCARITVSVDASKRIHIHRAEKMFSKPSNYYCE